MTEFIETDLIRESITTAFGDRCPEFVIGCAVCETWRQYDELISATKSPKNRPGIFRGVAEFITSMIGRQ